MTRENTTAAARELVAEQATSVLTLEELRRIEVWAEPLRRAANVRRATGIFVPVLVFFVCWAVLNLVLYPVAMVASVLLEFPFDDPMFVSMMGGLGAYLLAPYFFDRQR